MRRPTVLIATWVVVAICQVAFCQENRLVSVPTGLAQDDYAFLSENKVKSSVQLITGKRPFRRLPISLDQYLPSVLNQGSQGSCTAFAVAEALSIRENYTNKVLRSSASKLQALYSPTYLWVLGNRKRAKDDDCTKNGISYSTVFSCLFNDKLVYWNIYPYPPDDRNLCHSSCPEEIKRQKIMDRRFAYDDVILDTSAFKDLLNQGYPICIATELDMGFYDALYCKSGKWKRRLPKTGEQHAMLVVDYDDDMRCFKVLDSHGDQVGDHGFIWLSYDLVNRNLDAGVVYGCYIVSFERDIQNGPTKNVHYTSSAISDSKLKIDASFLDDEIAGRILDDKGKGIPNALVNLKGTTNNGTVTDVNGNFNLKAPSDAIFEVSNLGYAPLAAHLEYNSSTTYEKNLFTTWTKEGYYRIFNGIRIGVIDLNRDNGTVLLSIKDDNTGKLLTNCIQLNTGEKAEFTFDDKKFSIKLNEIKHAGNLLNINNWYAAFLEYQLLSDKEVLTQYF